MTYLDRATARTLTEKITGLAPATLPPGYGPGYRRGYETALSDAVGVVFDHLPMDPTDAQDLADLALDEDVYAPEDEDEGGDTPPEWTPAEELAELQEIAAGLLSVARRLDALPDHDEGNTND